MTVRHDKRSFESTEELYHPNESPNIILPSFSSASVELVTVQLRAVLRLFSDIVRLTVV